MYSRLTFKNIFWSAGKLIAAIQPHIKQQQLSEIKLFT